MAGCVTGNEPQPSRPTLARVSELRALYGTPSTLSVPVDSGAAALDNGLSSSSSTHSKTRLASTETSYYVASGSSTPLGTKESGLPATVAEPAASDAHPSPSAVEEPGRYDATDSELALVREMQAEAGGAFKGVDDFTVLRFLRAAKGSAKHARRRYADYVAWRAAERVDEIEGEMIPPDAELAARLAPMLNPRILDGYDKLGRPVVYYNMAAFDIVWIQKHGLLKALLRVHIRNLERILKKVSASPHPERGHLYIFDAGARPVRPNVVTFMRGLACGLWMDMANVGQCWYPELMGCMCIVRGSSIGAWCVKQVKRILDPETAAKFELHSGPPYNIVRMHLPASILPPEVLNTAPHEDKELSSKHADNEGSGGEGSAWITMVSGG